LSIHPNPVDDILTITKKANNACTELTILDISGKVVLIQKFEDNVTNSINLKDLPNGLYLVKLSQNGQIYYSKLIVQH
jgi:hypothetical protein